MAFQRPAAPVDQLSGSQQRPTPLSVLLPKTLLSQRLQRPAASSSQSQASRHSGIPVLHADSYSSAQARGGVYSEAGPSGRGRISPPRAALPGYWNDLSDLNDDLFEDLDGPDFGANGSRYVVSEEFRSLCQSQLQLLELLFSPEQAVRGAIRSTLYARLPQTFETGQLELQRVVDWDKGPSAMLRPTDGCLYLGKDADNGAEALLTRMPHIELPNGLVLPLAHGPYLVGLLVVERDTPQEAQPAGNMASGSTAAQVSHLEASYRREGPGGEAKPAASALTLDGPHDSAVGDTAWDVRHSAEAGPSGRDGGEGLVPGRAALFSGAELHSLQVVARALAAACAIDQRAFLDRRESVRGRQRYLQFAEQARANVSGIRTFIGMQAPRLEGAVERDLAKAISVQGARLAEVISQLQAALHAASVRDTLPSPGLLPTIPALSQTLLPRGLQGPLGAAASPSVLGTSFGGPQGLDDEVSRAVGVGAGMMGRPQLERVQPGAPPFGSGGGMVIGGDGGELRDGAGRAAGGLQGSSTQSTDESAWELLQRRRGEGGSGRGSSSFDEQQKCAA